MLLLGYFSNEFERFTQRRFLRFYPVEDANEYLKSKCVAETNSEAICWKLIENKTYNMKRHLLSSHRKDVANLQLGRRLRCNNDDSQTVECSPPSSSKKRKLVKNKSKNNFQDLIIGSVVYIYVIYWFKCPVVTDVPALT